MNATANGDTVAWMVAPLGYYHGPVDPHPRDHRCDLPPRCLPAPVCIHGSTVCCDEEPWPEAIAVAQSGRTASDG